MKQTVEVGLNFLPTVGPSEISAERFYTEILDLCETADSLGFAHLKTVEHYFVEWGGYSPDPVALLSAMAVRTRQIRLVTGAVVPAFTHPVKLAASLAVLDNLSGGRLDAGFARAFLPLEFDAFGVSMDQSAELFREGVAAVQALWGREDFRWEGRFHSFGPLPPLLPRPRQQGGPPVFVAATSTPESFEWAGRNGHHLMVIPMVVGDQRLAELLDLYREARTSAGHQDAPRIHVSYHSYVSDNGQEARRRAAENFDIYKAKQLESYSSWHGVSSNAYPGYEKMLQAVQDTTFDDLLKQDKVIVGDPEEVTGRLREVGRRVPGAEVSLHVRYGGIEHAEAHRCVELLGHEVLPALRSAE